MEDRLVSYLREKKMTITTVESCTGGMVAAKIVNVSGASYVFHEGFITYANSAKEKYAGVSKDTLDKCGAVSADVAMEMAEGAAKNTGADVAIATTGIAGPDGGTKEKPVGLVYIGCFVCGKIFYKKCHFEGDRLAVREQSTKEAIGFAYECLREAFDWRGQNER